MGLGTLLNVFLMLLGFFALFFRKKEKWLMLSALLFVSLQPAFFLRYSESRLLILGLIPIFILEGYGVERVFTILSELSHRIYLHPMRRVRKLTVAYILLCSIFLGLQIMISEQVFFAQPYVVETTTVSEWINSHLPQGTTMMVQFGLAPEIAYLTYNKVIGLPPDPSHLDFLIDHFDVKYVLVGSGFADRCRETIDWIKANPERFKLLKRFDVKYDVETFFLSIGTRTHRDRLLLYRVSL